MTECTLYGIIPDWYVFNIVVDLLNVSFAQLSTEYFVQVCGFVVAQLISWVPKISEDTNTM